MRKECQEKRKRKDKRESTNAIATTEDVGKSKTNGRIKERTKKERAKRKKIKRAKREKRETRE